MPTNTMLQIAPMPLFIICLGLARTIYIRCIYSVFGRGITKYTVYIYGSGQPYICCIHQLEPLFSSGQPNICCIHQLEPLFKAAGYTAQALHCTSSLNAPTSLSCFMAARMSTSVAPVLESGRFMASADSMVRAACVRVCVCV